MASKNVTEIRKFSKLLKDEPPKVVRGLALSLLARIVSLTPVEEGFAQGYWNVSIGSVGSPKLISKTSKTAVIDAGARVIEQVKAGDIVYIYNNVPYTIFLELGTRHYRPFAMVQTAFRELDIDFELSGGSLGSL